VLVAGVNRTNKIDDERRAVAARMRYVRTFDVITDTSHANVSRTQWPSFVLDRHRPLAIDEITTAPYLMDTIWESYTGDTLLPQNVVGRAYDVCLIFLFLYCLFISVC